MTIRILAWPQTRTMVVSPTAHHPASVQTQPGTSDCTALGSGIQAIYGLQRGTFDYIAGKYQAEANDGSIFVDGGSTCTWTLRDGTQIVYAAHQCLR